MGDLAQFIPGLIAATVFGLLTGPAAGRRLGVGRVLGTAVMISFGAIPATTLTPGGDIPTPGSQIGTCDLGRLGLASLTDLLTINEVSLNVLLFVPLGLALELLPHSRGKALAMAGAVALPFAIESIQLLAIPLGRYCDSADVADNLTGLFMGLLVGVLAGVVRRHRHRSTMPVAPPVEHD